MNDVLEIRPFISPVSANLRLPGSKSITNRALIAAALAQGTSTLSGVLFSDDTEAMLDCLESLGIVCEVDRDDSQVRVQGCGGRFRVTEATLVVRKSGTTSRFVVPMLALSPGRFLVDAHPQMRARPMKESAEALRAQGVVVRAAAGDHLPFEIENPADWLGPTGGSIAIAADTSSQFLSGLLLSAPYGRTPLEITVSGDLISAPYVEMTCKVMEAFGVRVDIDGSTFRVPTGKYSATDYWIEPDASTASYFFALAAITGGTVEIEGLTAAALQGDVAFVRDLETMGCIATYGQHSIKVAGPAGGKLSGGTFDMSSHSDTAPTMAAIAAFASDPVHVTNVGFIRHKESDRIGAVVTELKRCGIDAEENADGFVVRPSRPKPAELATYEDHRLAMSFSLIGVRSPGIKILDPGCVDKTFPSFFSTFDSLRVGKP